MKEPILVLLIIAAVLAVTCGCTEAEPEAQPTPVPTVTTLRTTSPTYHPTTTMPTLQQTPTVNDNTITITEEGFAPKTLTVMKGATVRWVNADSTEDPMVYNPAHRIKIINVYTGQIISPGQGWSWVFVDRGTFDYQDMMHPDLRGKVIVE